MKGNTRKIKLNSNNMIIIFNKQDDANCSDLDNELKDLNYKVGSLIFCHVWHSIPW